MRSIDYENLNELGLELARMEVLLAAVIATASDWLTLLSAVLVGVFVPAWRIWGIAVLVSAGFVSAVRLPAMYRMAEVLEVPDPSIFRVVALHVAAIGLLSGLICAVRYRYRSQRA